MSEKDRLNNTRALQDYIAYYERLSPRTIRLIEKIAAPDMRFKDPFNDVRGLDLFEKIMADMFDQVDNPRFKIHDYSWGKDGQAYLRWDMRFSRGGKEQIIPGMSEIGFDAKGRVASHVDYWDSGEYLFAKLPLIGPVINWIRRKIAVS